MRVVLTDSTREVAVTFDVDQDEDLNVAADGEIGIVVPHEDRSKMIIETSGLCSLSLVVGGREERNDVGRQCRMPAAVTSFAIQLGAYPTRQTAARRIAELERMGVDDLSIVQSNTVPSLCDNKQFLVLLGRFSTPGQRQAAREDLARQKPAAIADGTDVVTLSNDTSLRPLTC